MASNLESDILDTVNWGREWLVDFNAGKTQLVSLGWYNKESQCGLCNKSCYREYVRHLAVKNGEHIGISPLTNKMVQLRKDSAACHHLLNCSYSPTFEDFSVMCRKNIKYLLELKESLLIMRDRPSMIRNILLPLSICLNEFLSHCLLCSVDVCDQFFTHFL